MVLSFHYADLYWFPLIFLLGMQSIYRVLQLVLKVAQTRHLDTLHFCSLSTNLLFSFLYIKLARQQLLFSAPSEATIQSKRALNLNEIACYNLG